MKRLVLLNVMFVIALSAMAQNTYHPLLKEGKTWHYEGAKMMRKDGIYGPHIQYADYEQKGDTVINGNKYVKIYRTNPETKSTSYFGAYREEGKQVLRVMRGEQSETLLFDFDMAVGDELLSQPGVFLSNIDSVKTVHDDETFVFMRQTFSDENGNIMGCYVEGLGGINGMLNRGFNLGYNGPEDYTENFDCCKIGGHVVYDYNDMHLFQMTAEISQIYPSGQINKGNHFLFDLQGRRINGKPAKGMYIQGGKKHVVK